VRVSDTATSTGPTTGTLVTKSVSCTGGKVLVGGGAQFTTTGGNDAKAALKGSFPSVEGVNGTWRADAVVTGNFGAGNTLTLIVYAVCA
jgi:hypothetical protein